MKKTTNLDLDLRNTTPVRLSTYDRSLVWVILALLALSVVMVYSVSIVMADNAARYGQITPNHFLLRHFLAIGLGLTLAWITVHIPVQRLEQFTWVFLFLALAALFVVLFGRPVNGSRRWIDLGFFTFQPSEFAKLALAMYSAHYMKRKLHENTKFWRAVLPLMVVLAIFGALVMREPDMGTFVVLSCICVGILFLGGVNLRMLILTGAVLLGVFVFFIFFSDFRSTRVLAYLNPWDPVYSQGKGGYQLTHALIAIGRGGIWGQGLGYSIEKLHYLPEAHTDFIFAIIAEELGLVGVLVLIATFSWLIYRIFKIGRQAIVINRIYAGLLTQGIGIWLGFQMFVNMGVNMGVFPTKGFTLPFVSYGGSGMLMNLMAIAIVVRVDIEARLAMREGRA